MSLSRFRCLALEEIPIRYPLLAAMLANCVVPGTHFSWTQISESEQVGVVTSFLARGRTPCHTPSCGRRCSDFYETESEILSA